MPTVLDELLVETRVSLTGLQTGIREAEQLATQAKGRIANELAPTTFLVNTSEAIGQIRGLSEATTQLHASLVLLRAQLAQPFTVSVDTSQLRQAARDIAAAQAAMSNVGAPVTARAATGGAAPPASGGGAVVVRGGGASTPIIVSGPVMVAGPAVSAGGGFGGMIPPFAGARISLPGPMGGGSTINMTPNAAGVWTATGGGMGAAPPTGTIGGGTTGATAAGGMGLLGSIGTTIAYAAAFSAVYKIVGDIRDVWNDVIENGKSFNALMEVGTINIAALLSQTREFRSASGQIVDTLTNYKLQLGAAAGIQRELVRLDAETLGSVQDLQGVFAQVLAHTRGQVATDQQRLSLTTAILNASVLMGNTQQQHVIETRQTLTGQSHVGAVILQNLGIANRQIIAWREQGVLIEKLLERLELFNKLGKDAGTTWEGLNNSMTSLTGLLAGITGKDMFEGLRQFKIGEVTAMRSQVDSGAAFPVPLGVSDAAMREAGGHLAALWLRIAQSVTSTENSFIRLGVAGINAAAYIYNAWERVHAQFAQWTPTIPEWLKNAPISPLAAAGQVLVDTFAPSGPATSAADITTETDRLAVRLNSLAGADTSKMSSASFSQFLMALQQGQKATNDLRDAANTLHGTNQLNDADWKKLTTDLGTLNSAYSQTIAGFEHPLPATPGNDEKAARERERLMDRRESATRGADSAELALQQRIASITGDTAAMALAAEQKIEDARKEGIREAFGDASIIAAVNRKAAADRAALDLDATQRFIQNKHREDGIAEESAQRQLRASQIVSRGQQQLAEAQLTSVRRQLRIADERGAPPEVMNTLLNQERDAIERVRVIQLQRAQEEQTLANQKIASLNAEIAGYDRLIAQNRELRSLAVTWSMRQPGDVNAPFVSTTTGMSAPGTGGAKTEMLTDETRKLNGELLTWKARAQEAGDAMAKANEKAISETDRNIEAQRRLNMTVGQHIQEKLAQDARGSSARFADMWIHGIDRVSDALVGMGENGKFSFKGLLQVANEVLADIQREMLRTALRSLILGGQGGGADGGILGMLGGSLGGLFGGSSGGGTAWTVGGDFGNAPFIHNGGFIPQFASGGFAGNEVPAILHKGEMVLSAAETRNLMRYGSARLPGSGGGVTRGGGSSHVTNVHMTINTPDPNSFMRNQSQIMAQANRQVRVASMRNN